MEEEKYQKELFEFEKPKRIFPRLSDLLPKGDFENRIAITLTLERIVFIAIGLIMLMVVIYALGVERGKGAARTAARSSAESRISLVKTPQVQAAARPAERLPQKYVICAAAFARREYAAQAVKNLKASGFDAYLIQGGGFYRLCIGSYASKDAANNDLLKVRRIYKGAYIK